MTHTRETQVQRTEIFPAAVFSAATRLSRYPGTGIVETVGRCMLSSADPLSVSHRFRGGGGSCERWLLLFSAGSADSCKAVEGWGSASAAASIQLSILDSAGHGVVSPAHPAGYACTLTNDVPGELHPEHPELGCSAAVSDSLHTKHQRCLMRTTVFGIEVMFFASRVTI